MINTLKPVDQQYVALSCDTDGAYTAGYRFGFNGQQKDEEIKGKGNSLDFGARMYDSRLGRWISVDPAIREFPSLSSYVFSNNSPTALIDQEGKKYILYYKQFDSKDNEVEKDYVYGSKQPVPNNGFVKQTIAALTDLDRASSIQAKFDMFKNSPNKNVEIMASDETKADGNSSVGSFIRYRVYSNPFMGLMSKSSGSAMSPAEALWHEIGHQYDYDQDPKAAMERNRTRYGPESPLHKWSDAEEKYYIENN